MNKWHRIDGPTKVSLCEANSGDDATGEYAWSSLYGCGRARAEITHVLVVNDMMEEWSSDNRAYILEGTHLYIVDGDGEYDDYAWNDYEYESPGMYDYEWDERDRAYAALDEMATPDMSWALLGPSETLDPAPSDWNKAMLAEELLDIND